MVLFLSLKILESLQKKPRQSPKMIAEEIKTNPQFVRNRLSIFRELKLVKTNVRGNYEITSLGEYILKEASKEK